MAGVWWEVEDSVLDGTGKKNQGQMMESFVSLAKGGEPPRPEGKAAQGMECVTVMFIEKRS